MPSGKAASVYTNPGLTQHQLLGYPGRRKAVEQVYEAEVIILQ